MINSKEKTYERSASSLADAKRGVVDAKLIFRRLGRLRLSAIVSSRMGARRLYRPTPTDCKRKNKVMKNGRENEPT
jgi:hypothetical protein